MSRFPEGEIRQFILGSNAFSLFPYSFFPGDRPRESPKRPRPDFGIESLAGKRKKRKKKRGAVDNRDQGYKRKKERKEEEEDVVPVKRDGKRKKYYMANKQMSCQGRRGGRGTALGPGFSYSLFCVFVSSSWNYFCLLLLPLSRARLLIREYGVAKLAEPRWKYDGTRFDTQRISRIRTFYTHTTLSFPESGGEV